MHHHLRVIPRGTLNPSHSRVFRSRPATHLSNGTRATREGGRRPDRDAADTQMEASPLLRVVQGEARSTSPPRPGYDGGNVSKEDVLSRVGSRVYASTNHRAPRRGAAVHAGGYNVIVSES